jgi:hypothetical protein
MYTTLMALIMFYVAVVFKSVEMSRSYPFVGKSSSLNPHNYMCIHMYAQVPRFYLHIYMHRHVSLKGGVSNRYMHNHDCFSDVRITVLPRAALAIAGIGVILATLLLPQQSNDRFESRSRIYFWLRVATMIVNEVGGRCIHKRGVSLRRDTASISSSIFVCLHTSLHANRCCT